MARKTNNARARTPGSGAARRRRGGAADGRPRGVHRTRLRRGERRRRGGARRLQRRAASTTTSGARPSCSSPCGRTTRPPMRRPPSAAVAAARRKAGRDEPAGAVHRRRAGVPGGILGAPRPRTAVHGRRRSAGVRADAPHAQPRVGPAERRAARRRHRSGRTGSPSRC